MLVLIPNCLLVFLLLYVTLRSSSHDPYNERKCFSLICVFPLRSRIITHSYSWSHRVMIEMYIRPQYFLQIILLDKISLFLEPVCRNSPQTGSVCDKHLLTSCFSSTQNAVLMFFKVLHTTWSKVYRQLLLCNGFGKSP